MRSKGVLLLFVFILATYVHGQDEPTLDYEQIEQPAKELTSEQIKQHAYELGVPYEALRQLIASHRSPVLNNPNAKGAQLLSFRELDFMRASDMLVEGYYYLIYAWYFSQRGRTVFLDASSNDSSMISLDANFLVEIPERSYVIALVGVRADMLGRPRELFLEELVLRR
ncbi:MAG: hypothetical protein FWB78_05805 [Treponema sp.]|nr:hypothetical protein [Treponema sp.]